MDEQRFGPYRFWNHSHRFQEVEGGVDMEDVAHYALPLGALGRVAHRWVVRPRLEAIFDARREALNELFPDSDSVFTPRGGT